MQYSRPSYRAVMFTLKFTIIKSSYVVLCIKLVIVLAKWEGLDDKGFIKHYDKNHVTS